jgi:hypothetical protein
MVLAIAGGALRRGADHERHCLHHPDADPARGAGLGAGRGHGRDWKGRISWIAYAVAIGLAFVQPLAAKAIYLLVAIVWFIRDPRVERALKDG